MKPLIPFILVALLSWSDSTAQKVHITDSANHWRTTGQGGMDPTCFFCREYHWGNDTVIQGNHYRPLGGNSWSLGSIGMGICGGGGADGYWIREDTLAGMVYYRLLGGWDTLEHVLYNYNLQPGDSMVYYFNAGTPYVDTMTDKVVRVDSILINGSFHRTWLMQATAVWGRSYQVTEGIGTSGNPVWPAFLKQCFEYEEKLLEFRIDTAKPSFSIDYYFCDTFLRDSYLNGRECVYVGSGGGGGGGGGSHGIAVHDVNRAADNILVAPNPARDRLIITNKGPRSSVSMVMYNVAGECVLRTKADNLQLSVLDVANMPDGVYILLITTADGYAKRERVLLQK